MKIDLSLNRGYTLRVKGEWPTPLKWTLYPPPPLRKPELNFPAVDIYECTNVKLLVQVVTVCPELSTTNFHPLLTLI